MVKCGICVPEYEARRDYLQSVLFPKKHPGVGYIEKGEIKITFGVSTTAAPKNTNHDEDTVADYINEYVADLDEVVENLN